MRLVDEVLILQNLECLQKSPWYNDGKDPESGRRWQFNTRKEAAEIVRDLCIRPVPTVDAIPVEWLRSQLKNNPNDIESAYDDICINELIDRWQKEQEAR